MPQHKIEALPSWDAFKLRLLRFLSYDADTRRTMVFRGHASNQWKLAPTIDRLEATKDMDSEQRAAFRSKLIDEFRANCMGLQTGEQHPTTEEEWEFLGRHHGLPTTIMDWTYSPYVAAFFAFESEGEQGHASIWVLECVRSRLHEIFDVTMDQFNDTIRFNIRAAEQRGVSMRVLFNDHPVEDLLAAGLTRLDIPRTARESALRDLDEMLITHRTLYRDISAAAKVAVLRTGAR